MTFGEKIKEIRKKFGLTQEELAEKLNVSRQAIAKWEMDNGISKLFGTSIDNLLDNTTNIPLMILHKEINLKDYGNWKGEQYLNILNETFDKDWKIYILNYRKKINTVGGIIDFLTFRITELEDLSPYYLAVKDNIKLLANIKDNVLEIRSLSSDVDIKKFTLEKKIYTNYGELKR